MILDFYTDESLRARFRSLGCLSGTEDNLRELRDNLQDILDNFNVSEIKFNEVKTHLPKIECAKKFIDEAIDFASKEKIRIDILIWDIEDSRHKILGRDDIENLERMYFHLLRHVIEMWKIFKCNFYPDEHSEYKYNKIADYLSSTKYPRREIPELIKLFIVNRIQNEILKVEQQISLKQPLIQLVDLFCGFGCFSREKSNEYKNWKRKQESKYQPSLFNEDIQSIKENNTNIKRFELITHIAEKCKKKRIDISINTNCYLKTYNKKLPINFWHYEPQGDYDKAPTRNN